MTGMTVGVITTAIALITVEYQNYRIHREELTDAYENGFQSGKKWSRFQQLKAEDEIKKLHDEIDGLMTLTRKETR